MKRAIKKIQINVGQYVRKRNKFRDIRYELVKTLGLTKRETPFSMYMGDNAR
jgi:hypothetical protein